MPTDEEVLESSRLRATTSLSPAQLQAAAGRAQVAGKRTMANTIKIRSEVPGQINYSIRGPGGVVEQLSFSLSWGQPADDGPTSITTTVHQYMTLRSKMFGISYGPKKVPALRSYQQYVEWMSKELTA